MVSTEVIQGFGTRSSLRQGNTKDSDQLGDVTYFESGRPSRDSDDAYCQNSSCDIYVTTAFKTLTVIQQVGQLLVYAKTVGICSQQCARLVRKASGGAITFQNLYLDLYYSKDLTTISRVCYGCENY